MALVSLLSWHYSVSYILFDAAFLVRKHSCPLLWDNTDCAAIELFQKYSAGKEHRLGNPFKVYFKGRSPFFFLFCLFRATPLAYEGSHARGLIGAVAAGLHYSHSHAGSEPHCSSRQCQILNPMSEARGRTGVLMDAGWVC